MEPMQERAQIRTVDQIECHKSSRKSRKCFQQLLQERTKHLTEEQVVYLPVQILVAIENVIQYVLQERRQGRLMEQTVDITVPQMFSQNILQKLVQSHTVQQTVDIPGQQILQKIWKLAMKPTTPMTRALGAGNQGKARVDDG